VWKGVSRYLSIYLFGLILQLFWLRCAAEACARADLVSEGVSYIYAPLRPEVPRQRRHNNPASLDSRLFFTVVLAVAPAVTMDEASSLSIIKSLLAHLIPNVPLTSRNQERIQHLSSEFALRVTLNPRCKVDSTCLRIEVYSRIYYRTHLIPNVSLKPRNQERIQHLSSEFALRVTLNPRRIVDSTCLRIEVNSQMYYRTHLISNVPLKPRNQERIQHLSSEFALRVTLNPSCTVYFTCLRIEFYSQIYYRTHLIPNVPLQSRNQERIQHLLSEFALRVTRNPSCTVDSTCLRIEFYSRINYRTHLIPNVSLKSRKQERIHHLSSEFALRVTLNPSCTVDSTCLRIEFYSRIYYRTHLIPNVPLQSRNQERIQHLSSGFALRVTLNPSCTADSTCLRIEIYSQIYYRTHLIPNVPLQSRNQERIQHLSSEFALRVTLNPSCTVDSTCLRIEFYSRIYYRTHLIPNVPLQARNQERIQHLLSEFALRVTRNPSCTVDSTCLRIEFYSRINYRTHLIPNVSLKSRKQERIHHLSSEFALRVTLNPSCTVDSTCLRIEFYSRIYYRTHLIPNVPLQSRNQERIQHLSSGFALRVTLNPSCTADSTCLRIEIYSQIYYRTHLIPNVPLQSRNQERIQHLSSEFALRVTLNPSCTVDSTCLRIEFYSRIYYRTHLIPNVPLQARNQERIQHLLSEFALRVTRNPSCTVDSTCLRIEFYSRIYYRTHLIPNVSLKSGNEERVYHLSAGKRPERSRRKLGVSAFLTK